MEFIVEFYETAAGKCPVREFLDELKARRSRLVISILRGNGCASGGKAQNNEKN
jgi:hypothetical protein